MCCSTSAPLAALRPGITASWRPDGSWSNNTASNAVDVQRRPLRALVQAMSDGGAVLDIEDFAQLTVHLRSRGYLSANAALQAEVLRGGVSNRTVQVRLPGASARSSSRH